MSPRAKMERAAFLRDSADPRRRKRARRLQREAKAATSAAIARELRRLAAAFEAWALAMQRAEASLAGFAAGGSLNAATRR